MESALSDAEDLDLAEALSRFELEQVALQAAQQTFNMVQGLSLFNYL
jgi:flagellar hook-associated protein 3 FlgL